MPAIRCLVLKANEKTIALQLNSVVVNWVSLLILKEIYGKVRASCFVHFRTEHEIKAARKRVTSFVSDDTAERYLFSLCFKRSLYLDYGDLRNLCGCL